MINRKKIDQISLIIIGVCFLLFGAHVYFDPIFYSRKHGMQFDFEEYHKLIGLFISLIGLIFLILIFRKKDR